MFDRVIAGGKLIDGTGAPWRWADVGISGGRIAAIGRLTGAPAAQRIQAEGRIVCPGFIDIHSHADIALLADRYSGERLLQGITTEVVGQDGLAYTPARGARLDQWRRYLVGLNGDFPEVVWDWATCGELMERYDRRAANVVYLVPHGAVRVEAMGWEPRPATDLELDRMQDLVRQELEQGASGLSTGLTYIPCTHATTEEMVKLCEPVAQAGGIFSIHLRSYGPQLLTAMDEAIEIGQRTGVAVQISHLRVADLSNWGMAEAMMERIDRARAGGVDVTFDVYPYTVGCAPLICLLPGWVQSGGPDAVMGRLSDPREQLKISAEMNAWALDWSMYVLSNAPATPFGNWEGMSVTGAAQALGIDVTLFVVRLLAATELNATIISAGGSEADNQVTFCHPAGMVCSDGILLGGKPHPRGFGAFPRVIAHYVRRKAVLSMEAAIHKMTGASASRLNLQDRGLVRTGAAADIVVFDPECVADGATFVAGRTPPTGIEHVLVNGQPAVANGQYLPCHAGTCLKPLLAR